MYLKYKSGKKIRKSNIKKKEYQIPIKTISNLSKISSILAKKQRKVYNLRRYERYAVTNALCRITRAHPPGTLLSYGGVTPPNYLNPL